MKFKIFLGVAVGVMIAAPLVVLGAYNDVNLSSGTTIRTTVGSETFDLAVTNGVIQSITVNSDSMDITFAAGSGIIVTSSNRSGFTYNLDRVSASFECGSSSSVLNLSLSPGQSSTGTAHVTPTGTTCVAASTGGGGSSSSTSSTQTTTTSTTSTTSTTPSTTTTTTSTSAMPSTTSTTVAVVSTPTTVAAVTAAPAVVSAPAVVLSTELDPGVRSDEVTTLQTLLAKDPTIYPEGTVSGFYGPKTTAAVKKFQAKYGLPTVGRVGPATLEKINEVYSGTSSVATPSASAQFQTTEQIQSQIQIIQQQIQALTSGATATGAITTELDPGVRSDEVTTLQTLLAKDPTIYPEGTVSGFYGPKTTAAVKKFQAKYGLPTVGRVGPATMQKINEVLGGQSAPVTSESPSSQVPESTVTASTVDQIAAQIQAIQEQINALLGK